MDFNYIYYTVSKNKPHNGFIEFQMQFYALKGINKLKLPSWRPGRYEMGNFAQFVRLFEVSDKDNHPIEVQKTDKDQWVFESLANGWVNIKYEYYGQELNAGSTYVADNQIYLNPVNCMLYCPDYDKSYQVKFKSEKEFQIACAKNNDKGVLLFDNHHQLYDHPIIYSKDIQHKTLPYESCRFHLWFQGICDPDWEKISADFIGFIKVQHQLMEGFPFEDYHFFFQILPHAYYHGVEHINSTVIALGPGYDIMNDIPYQSLLGVSSHELYHAWNIKTIRPKEMAPYHYNKENYSNLGYVAEGVTTYMGDLCLLRAGAYSFPVFLQHFSRNLLRHIQNYAWQYKSLTESSRDTWLDGYKMGIPHRKQSIYSEGALVAFIGDTIIRQKTANQQSLDTVMLALYKGKKNEHQLNPYSEQDYFQLLEQFGGKKCRETTEMLVSKKVSLLPDLKVALNYLGLELSEDKTQAPHENILGLQLISGNKVNRVYPQSIAFLSGIMPEDQIISIMDVSVYNFPDDTAGWLNYFSTHPQIKISIERKGVTLPIILSKKDQSLTFPNFLLNLMEKPNAAQKANLKAWAWQNMP